MTRAWLRSLFLLALVRAATAAHALGFAVNEGVTYRVTNDEIRAKYAVVAADLGKTKGDQKHTASFLVRAESTAKTLTDLKDGAVGAPDEDSITAWMVRASLRDSFGGTPPLRYFYTRLQDAVPFFVDNGDEGFAPHNEADILAIGKWLGL